MITDARVLQPEFIPKEVKHRSTEVSHLSDRLRPVVDGDRPDPAFLYGPSGAGKTCIAKYTLKQLREQVVSLNYQYVNCWENYREFRTLMRLLEGIDRGINIHRRSTPRDELVERLREYTGPPYIVILDEADQLEDKRLLYDLHQMPHITMILIANNEEDVFAHVDDRLASRLTNCVRIKFSQYTLDQLVAILQDRVRWGLDSNAISDEGLELIADKAAGDARVAIGILRNAAKTAHRGSHETISESIIREAVSDAKTEVQQKTIDRLTDQQQSVYEIIEDADTIRPKQLYERYRERVADPKSRRTVRNYLDKLEQYNLIEAQGKTKGRTYRLKRPQ